MTKTHKCPCCNRRKLNHLFYKDSRRKDGLSCYCKRCINTIAKTKYDTNDELRAAKKARSTKRYQEKVKKD